MSLINDALRRAQEARQQQPAAPTPGPPLHPVAPPPSRWHGLGLLLVFGALLILAAALIWLGIQQTRQPQAVASPPSPSTQVAAPTVPPTPPAAPSVAVVPPQEQAPTASAAVPPSAPSQATSQPAPTTPPGPAAVASALSNLPSGDNARPVVETRPPPPKLQGIIFHPTRPSAVLNGRLLFVGERLGEWRVTAIDARSVTVVAAGQTNVLELP